MYKMYEYAVVNTMWFVQVAVRVDTATYTNHILQHTMNAIQAKNSICSVACMPHTATYTNHIPQHTMNAIHVCREDTSNSKKA